MSRTQMLEALEQRRLLSSGGAIGVWTGLGDGFTWHDPFNWSQNTLPGINDDVVLEVPANPTILVNQPAAVRRVMSNEAIDVVAALRVDAPSQFNGALRLWGAFGGAGDATFASTLDWYGGRFEPGGKVIIADGAELNIHISGSPQDVLTHELKRSLDNYGFVNLTAGYSGYTAALSMSDCIFDNKPGATLRIEGDVPGLSVLLAGEGAIVNNAGTVSILIQTQVRFSAEYRNHGTTIVNGELNLDQPGTGSGQFLVGARLNFLSDYELSEGSLLTGSGIVAFYGDATVNGDVIDLGLLAVSTSGEQQVAFNGSVAVDQLICVNASALPALIATFNGPTDAEQIRVLDGAVQFNSSVAAGSTEVESFQLGAGLLELAGSFPDLGDLLIDNSTVHLQSGERPYRALRITSLVSSGDWSVDLGNGALIVDYQQSSPLDQIRTALAGAYAEGGWNGSGITSSDAAFSPNHALGFAESSDLFKTFPALFAGQKVDDSAVLVRFTRYGDANLDKEVDLRDFNRLAAHFGAGKTLWSEGNFNYDTDTDLSDFDLLAANFGQAPALPAGWVSIDDIGEERISELE